MGAYVETEQVDVQIKQNDECAGGGCADRVEGWMCRGMDGCVGRVEGWMCRQGRWMDVQAGQMDGCVDGGCVGRVEEWM